VLSEKQLIEKLTRINSVSEFSSNDSNASEILCTPLQNVHKKILTDKGYSTDPFARSKRTTVIRAKAGPVSTVISCQQSTPTTFRRVTRRSSMLMQQQQISSTSDDDNVQLVTKKASQLSMDDFVDKTLKAIEATPTKPKTPFKRRRTMFTPRLAERIVEEVVVTPTEKKNSTMIGDQINAIFGSSQVITQKNDMVQTVVSTEIEAQTKISTAIKDSTITKNVALTQVCTVASDPMELDKNTSHKTRKTVYSPQAMDESSKEDTVASPKPRNDLIRRTLNTPQPMEQTFCYSGSNYTPILKGKNCTNRRKTMHISFAEPQNKKENEKENIPSAENSPINIHRGRIVPDRIGLYSAVKVHEASSIFSTLSSNSSTESQQSIDSQLPLTLPRQSLLVEKEATSSFSSARLPNQNNRKSIIDMRIDDINTKNRRLTMPSTANEFVVEKVVDVLTSVTNSSLFGENSNTVSTYQKSSEFS
jgi:hypothetical protein